MNYQTSMKASDAAPAPSRFSGSDAPEQPSPAVAFNGPVTTTSAIDDPSGRTTIPYASYDTAAHIDSRNEAQVGPVE
jgi:hypothetical protein